MKLRLRLFACLLTTSAAGLSFAGQWTKIQISVPNELTLQRLIQTELSTSECVNHLGWNDAIVGPQDWPTVWRNRFVYRVVGSAADPTVPTPHAQEATDYRNEYFNADEILGFYEGLRTQYPAFVTRAQIGSTINGEPMWVYKIGAPSNSREAPKYVIQGLIHAREWITGAAVMHVAKMFLNDAVFGSGPRSTSGSYLYVVPMANPDGYRYTWTNNRMWRKNRRLNSNGSRGVDINRNYSTGWGLNGGSSSNQNSETYRGTAAFSEPESRAVRDLMASMDNVKGFIDFHSYGQLVLQPWGYTTTAPPDASVFDAIGIAVKNDMGLFGAPYSSGQTANILYIASGVTQDYAYSTYGTKGIGIELRDTGTNGFTLPANQISVSQDEAWAGFQRYVESLP